MIPPTTDVFADLAPTQRRWAAKHVERIHSLNPQLEHLSTESVRELVQWYFDEPEWLHLPKEDVSREHQLREYGIPQVEATQDRDGQEFERRSCPEDLRAAFGSQIVEVISKNPSKRKQVFALETLGHLAADREGYRLEEVVEYYCGPAGERRARINASAVTTAINRLPKEVRGDQTVTVTTVRSALQALLDNIQTTEGQSGQLRTRQGTINVEAVEDRNSVGHA